MAAPHEHRPRPACAAMARLLLLLALLEAPRRAQSQSASWLHFVTADDKVCGADGASESWLRVRPCVYGQCCAKTRGCSSRLDRCVAGQGTCMQRLANQSLVGEPALDRRDALDDKRYFSNDAAVNVVRCKRAQATPTTTLTTGDAPDGRTACVYRLQV